MASLHQRNRIVVFRLSQEEYDKLVSACAAGGGRNLSDFTRTELFAAVHAKGRGSLMERKFIEIDRKLDDLYALLERFSERFAPAEESLAIAHNGPCHK